MGDIVILHYHSLSFLRDLHSNLDVIAVIFCQNDNVAHQYNQMRSWRDAPAMSKDAATVVPGILARGSTEASRVHGGARRARAARRALGILC